VLDTTEDPQAGNLGQVIQLPRPYFPGDDFTWGNLETPVGKGYDALESKPEPLWIALAALASLIEVNGGEVHIEVQKAIGAGRWQSSKKQADDEWLKRVLDGIWESANG